MNMPLRLTEKTMFKFSRRTTMMKLAMSLLKMSKSPSQRLMVQPPVLAKSTRRPNFCPSTTTKDQLTLVLGLKSQVRSVPGFPLERTPISLIMIMIPTMIGRKRNKVNLYILIFHLLSDNDISHCDLLEHYYSLPMMILQKKIRQHLCLPILKAIEKNL